MAVPRRLSENGYFSQSPLQAKIIILEILQCIPVVIIFSFLDLEKTISFSDSLLVTRLPADGHENGNLESKESGRCPHRPDSSLGEQAPGQGLTEYLHQN